MFNRGKPITILVLSFVAIVLFSGVVFAAPYNLSGRVTDQSGDPLPDTVVEVLDPGTGAVVASAATDGTGNYAFTIEEGTYDLRIIPPQASGFGESFLQDQEINNDTMLDFILVPAGFVTLSGRILDGQGIGIANQNINLRPQGGQSLPVSTDSSGNYSFSVASGDYQLTVNGNPGPTLAAPRYYYLQSSVFSLSEDTILDVPLPVKEVMVHVQDPSGNPVANVGVRANASTWNYGYSVNGILWNGYSNYNDQASYQTDAGGDVILWLFPTPSNNNYTFTAFPTEGSSLAITYLQNVSILADATVPLTLEIPVTLSGRILDGQGIGIANQNINLRPQGGQSLSVSTDSSGNYSFSVASGDYQLTVNGNPGPTLAAPRYYYLQSSVFSLSEDTILDVPLPVKEVMVHVQDPSGNPVANVGVRANASTWNYGYSVNGILWNGYSNYNDQASYQTDAGGDVIL